MRGKFVIKMKATHFNGGASNGSDKYLLLWSDGGFLMTADNRGNEERTRYRGRTVLLSGLPPG